MRLLPAVIFLSGCSERKEPPRAVKGVLDLSQWGFEKDGIVELRGHWEFYWNRLLTPEAFSRTHPAQYPDFFNVPGLWGGIKLKTNRYPGDGFTTYRLNLKLPPNRETLALRVGLIQTAYKIWINGEHLASGGIVGNTPQSSKPQAEVGLYSFRNPDDHLEIIIQVSNFFQSRGGMRGQIFLGTQEQIRKRHNSWPPNTQLRRKASSVEPVCRRPRPRRAHGSEYKPRTTSHTEGARRTAASRDTEHWRLHCQAVESPRFRTGSTRALRPWTTANAQTRTAGNKKTRRL